MNEIRDFKGVWIPKEIWLSENLTLLEKCIYTEISSLDNADHCSAGNEYLANFCNCSESAVSKAIKHLQELGFIEILSFDGRHRKIRVVNFTTLPSKIYEAASEILPSININNNKNNKKEIPISKDIGSTQTNFQFGKSNKQPKESMWDKCINLIDDFARNNSELRTVLVQVLRQFIDNSKESGIPFYTNNFKGKLNSLKRLTDDHGYLDANLAVKIVKQTIDKGWNDFYQLKSDGGSNKKQPATDMGYVSERADKNAKVYEKF